MAFKLRWYQEEAVQAFWDYFNNGNRGNPVLVLPTGCHAKGTPILMYNGSIKSVEDVEVGDLLMGDDNTPRTVLQLARGRERMFKIIPVKGEPFVVNENHILSLRLTNGTKTASLPDGSVVDITVAEYLKQSNHFKHCAKQYRKSITTFANNTYISFDPYAMGLLLGDGSLRNSGCSLTTADPELADYFKMIAASYGDSIRISHKPNSKAASYYSVGGGVVGELRDIGIYGHTAHSKYIPKEYLTSTVENREALLAGLLDSDGHMYASRGGFEYSTVSKQLNDDVLFLCRSLGFAAYSTVKKTTCQNGFKGTAYRISISGEFSNIPFVREKHVNNVSERKQVKNVLHTGFSVEELNDDSFYGFHLDGNHRYCMGDFTVTHNSGKSVVIAEIIRGIFSYYPGQRVLVLAHVKELVEQNYKKLKAVWPDAPAGICSAGLGRTETNLPITFGGIGSVVGRAEQYGRIDLVFVDECHRIAPNERTAYRKLIAALMKVNPYLKVVGLTATPFRLGMGMITEKGGVFTDIAYNLSTPENFRRLIAEGYLAPLVSRKTDVSIDASKIAMRGGEFVESAVQEATGDKALLQKILRECVLGAWDRKKWIIFASGVENCGVIAEMLNSMGIYTKAVHGELANAERDAILTEFTQGNLRCVVNQDILTTGFDCPQIDFIGSIRLTNSPILWLQMLGRGMRPAPGKINCLVFDFAGNTRRCGPVDKPNIPKKKSNKPGDCPMRICDGVIYDKYSGKPKKCATEMHPSVRECPVCGKLFEFKEAEFEEKASTAELMTCDQPVVEIWQVKKITFKAYQKRGSNRPSLLVTYKTNEGDINEFVPFEGQGRGVGCRWWRDRDPQMRDAPQTVDRALDLCSSLNRPYYLRVWTNKEKFPEIMAIDTIGNCFGTIQPTMQYAPTLPTIEIKEGLSTSVSFQKAHKRKAFLKKHLGVDASEFALKG